MVKGLSLWILGPDDCTLGNPLQNYHGHDTTIEYLGLGLLIFGKD